MKMSIRLLALLLVLGSGTSMAAKEIKTKDFSGWLDDYDTLTYNEDRNAFMFSNEKFQGTFQKVLLEPVELYSATGKANGEEAKKAAAYLDEGLRKILSDKGILASEPGPKVARLRIAITGVEKTKEELKAYNLIPVSAVFRGAQAATGNVATYLATMFEGEAVDSATGERALAIVIKSISETDKRSGDIHTFEDFKPTLDQWLAQYSRTVEQYLEKKAGS
jgi:hypothetical protein